MAADTQDAHLEVPENAEQRQPGKLQPFKRLFRKRRKKEQAACFEEAGLKASRSTGDVCSGAQQHLRELKALGSRAVSHDSVFDPEVADGAESMSQENVSDRVRSLQKQIAQSIKFGQKSSSLRKSEEEEGSSDEEEAPRRPLQVLAQVEAEPANAKVEVQAAVQGGAQAEAQDTVLGSTMGTPVKSPRAKRAPPAAGTIESINLDAVPLSFSCLDSTAARHKLSVKPKNQRLSRKHRRFTQDVQEICAFEELREDSAPQTPAGTVSNWSREDREAALWREDECLSGSPEKSKKPKLQAETCLVDVDWRCEGEQDARKQSELEEKRQNAEEEMRKKQQKPEELILHETDETKRREEKEDKMTEDQDATRKGEEEAKRRKSGDEVEKQSTDVDVRQQEMFMEFQRFKEEMRQTEEQEEKEEDKKLSELEEQRLREDDQLLREVKEGQSKRDEEQRQAEKKRMMGEEKEIQQKETETLQQEEKQQPREVEQKKLPQDLTPMEKTHRCAEEGTHPEEWKQKAEELRWKEMEERQRPFTFKVSSGEKQILFQRVNLSPVTPTGQQGDTAESKLSKSPAMGSIESPTLLSSMFVPHTAILVTGAQLCGAAVNLDQIKDPACKSLLGLSEDKKAVGLSSNKGPSKTSPERKSGKTKSLNESSPDQLGSAVLAEWATIRSKIFKRAENGSMEDKDSRHPNPNQSPSEDLSQKPVSTYHSHLRKTVSANAKFSITPARQKFPDLNKTSEGLNHGEKDGGQVKSSSPDTGSPPPVSPGAKPQSKVSKSVRILDRTEGCLFAKDLPSFLVPSPPQASLRTRSQSEALSPADSDSGSDNKGQSGEDRASPFGIKLRRTNYSLRFRSEQPVEKRKKRYSAGDSFDGIPVPLTSADPDSDTSVPSDKSSPSSPLRRSAGHSTCAGTAVEPNTPVGRVAHPAAAGDSDRSLPRPLPQKPLIAPKPGSGTPPPSPRSPQDPAAPGSAGASNAYVGKQEAGKGQESSGLQPRSQQEEEGPKERKSFFPTISIPWREKGDRRTEVLRREKPFLQSRHSLDIGRVQGKETGSQCTDSERVPEKEAGPLWITLALQKQKGFREQQQSREEHRHMREVRLAEKQAREQGGDLSGSRTSTQKVPEGEKADSPLSAFERREHLRKANTLPGSVTVEIADATSSALPVKDSAKRFPPPENVQVSTEPAWLALAKRKAKAWSDCPQIIK